MIDDVEGLPKHLCVGIPAYTGQVASQTATTLAGIQQCCGLLGIEMTPLFLGGCCYIDLARNQIVGDFLKTEADALLFLDADVGAEPAAIGKLMKAQKAVVAGVYPKKIDGAVSWPVLFPGSGLYQSPSGALEASHLPTGYLLVYRQVFEAMQTAVPAFKNDRQEPLHAYFETRIEDGRYWGEDFVFCKNWRGMGGKVWMVPDISFDHAGTKLWSGNYASWYASRESWERIDGFLWCPEMYKDAIIEAEDGAHFVEVGAWKGRSAAFMAEHIKALGNQKRITFDVVDHFRGSPELAHDEDVKAKRLYEVFMKNTAYCREYISTVRVARSVDAAKAYKEESLDWVFLDAGHDEISVYDDCSAWWPRVKPGGVLAGDDWNWQSVQSGLTKYFDTLPGDYKLEQIGAAGWRIRKPAEE